MKLNLKKQIIAFGISALALVGAGAGITYALFQDAVTITDNVIVTGNLRADVTLYDADDAKIFERLASTLTPTTGLEGGILVEPSDIIPAAGLDFKLVITNQGSLSGTATVTLQDIFVSATSCGTYLPTGATCSNLADKDTVPEVISVEADATLNTVANGTQVAFTGTQLLAATDDTLHLLSSGATGVTLAPSDTLEILIHIDVTLNNDYHNVLTKVFAFVTTLQIDITQVE